ncbi:MAG: hypothetical protein JRE23_12535 [Deltaproteobacteria bacterium]|nr:hypothetical protein [Deltaproteobacteria bacterium]
MTTKLIFDPKRHEYTVGGVRLPSVTGILNEVFQPKNYAEEYHLTRGKYAHLATELYDKGELDESTIDDTILPYLEAWRKFRTETGFVPEEIELKLYSETLRFAGTLDRIGTLGTDKILLDIKTGAGFGMARYQTAGYEILYGKKLKRYGVLLTAEGKYKIQPFKDKTDGNVFRACLTVYNVKKGGK